MDTRTVDQSALNSIAIAVDQLAGHANEIRHLNASIDSKAQSIDQDIRTVKSEFSAFKEFDVQQKELAQAKTRIVEVRQKLQDQFGINDTIRQYLTGILEASDLSLVRQNVITNVTERMMLSCPQYWLAPCLVAISAWLGNNQALAQRALAEAIKRDDEKTSLLFALVCRRVGRMNASAAWLERYLAMQDPKAIERKMVTVLDAYSNGLFGPQAKAICADRIEKWLDELIAEPGFVEAQQQSWEESMRSKMVYRNDSKRYPYAAKYCTNWKDLQKSLNEEALHEILLGYFRDIFEKPSGSTASLNKRLDDLMENYITSYDNAELPLRREERLLTLIIEERGRRSIAESRYQAEQKAMDEVFDFTQLLTSAAMHADIIKASNATQRLSIALSRDWVVSAFNNIQMEIRSGIPDRFTFEIAGFTGEIRDGSEEEELISAAKEYFKQQGQKEMDQVKQSIVDMILPAVTFVFGLITMFSNRTFGLLFLLSTAGLVLRWYLNKKKCEKQKEDIRNRYNQLFKDAKSVISALCAERVDYMNDIAGRDAVSEELGRYLSGIEVGQHTSGGGSRLSIV